MTRFEFPMDRLLSVKRKLERRAEARQAEARRAWDQAEAVARALRRRWTEDAERANAMVGNSIAPYRWVAASEASDRLERAIALQGVEVKKRADAFEVAKRDRAQLARDVEALAELRQQRLEEWRREADRTEQQNLDEISVRRWRESQTSDRAKEATT